MRRAAELLTRLVLLTLFTAVPALAADPQPAPSSASAAPADSAADPPLAAPDTSSRDERGRGADEAEGTVIRARAMWFRDGHRGDTDVIPYRARSLAQAELERNLASGALKSSPLTVTGDRWISIGPNALQGPIPYSGRVTSLAADRAHPGTVYAGTAQGGVWKTANDGASWLPLTDDQKSLAIGSLAIDPSNPNRVFAGTGEPFDGCGAYYGSGILRSDDAGAHWTLLGESVFSGTSVSKIVVHPTNPSIVWAANAQGWAGFVCADPGAGVYGVRKSLDGGATWTLVLGTAQTGVPTYTYDLVIHPTNPSILYAAVHGSGVWKTTDGGASWTHLAGGLPSSDLGRVDIAISQDSPETLYAVYEAAASSSHLGTWKTVNGGSTWTALPKVPVGDTCMTSSLNDMCTYTEIPFPGFCNYTLYVEVLPGGTVMLGGTGLWRSTNGGSSWIDSCNDTLHVDQHALAVDGAGRIWIGNDGGVFRSDDGGANFLDMNNGLVTSQFYPGASLHPTRREFAIGGTQDNGSFLYSGQPAWTRINLGDGGFTAVDSSHPDSTWYVSEEYLALFKTTDGGATMQGVNDGLTDAGSIYAAFIAPFAMCPSNPSILVAGSDNVWKTQNGAAHWASNSPDPLVGLAQSITAIAFAPSDTTCNTVFIGMGSGRIYRTTSGGGMTGWTNISRGLPQRGVSDFAVHPTDANIVYVAVTGFGTPHLYRTTNALASQPTWTAISTGLPNVPANAVLLDPDDPNVVYAGTDLGIFRSADAGVTWSSFMDGHPNVAVYDLVADSSTGSLLSFTYGRGVWRLENCAVTCPAVGDSLRVARLPDAAQLSWGDVACSNLAHYEVMGSATFDAPWPAGWTSLGTPATPGFTDPIGSPWSAYRIRVADRCGRTTD